LCKERILEDNLLNREGKPHSALARNRKTLFESPQLHHHHFGCAFMTSEWREKLAMRELIEQRAAELHAMAYP
jgi:hypothetical protein